MTLNWILVATIVHCGIAFSSEPGSFDFCEANEDSAIHSNFPQLKYFNDDNKTCFNGSDVLRHVESNTILLACQKHYSLDFVVSLVNVSNITFFGIQSVSVFTCSGNSGLKIFNSKSVMFQNIVFSHCGTSIQRTYVKDSNKNASVTLNGAAFILDSSDITCHSISIEFSKGSGMVLINSQGHFLFSNFSSNSANTEENGGEGMRIELEGHFGSENFNLLIKNCTFENNVVSVEEKKFMRLCNPSYLVESRGGGLGIILRDTISVKAAEVTIVNSIFKNNIANWGSGLYVMYCASHRSTNVNILNTKFLNNTARRAGGGIDIGFKKHNSTDDNEGNNTFICLCCKISRNKANFGGGTAMFTDEFVNSESNSMVFSNSSWNFNEAFYGMAVDLSPRFVSTPTHKSVMNICFRNVLFFKNSFVTNNKGNSSECKEKGKGTLLSTGMTVVFKDSVKFTSNCDSAIYATSSILVFHQNSRAMFENNTGINGAAIALIGFSAIHVESNVTTNFFHNTASSRGGAIYHESINRHDNTFSRLCFIQRVSHQGTKINETVFNFVGNKAGSFSDHRDGNSIFATTLKPCQKYCMPSEGIIDDTIFTCIGKFNYSEDLSSAIATRAGCIYTNSKQELETFPGNSLKLEFNNTDDLEEEIQAIYHITATGDITVDESSVYTSVKAAVINGKPGSKGILTVSNVDIREAAVTFKVKLKTCPPFLVYSMTTNKCHCYSENGNHFAFLFDCNSEKRSSSLVHGYWVGLSNTSLDSLYFGYCPNSYCFFEEEENRIHDLPSNIEDLDDKICNRSKRTGRLCGLCQSNYSAHFHNYNFKCGDESTCTYGWFLYIISETLPLIFLFFIVIFFKINFTSGHLNGFLLFAQVVDSMLNISYGFVYYPKYSYYPIVAIQVFYKFFNLDFFAVGPLSFCLWRGATTLHMLSFKFVTVITAFVLVLAAVFILNRFTAVNKVLQYTKGSSVTHGLSAFLVMVYMQCTKVSFDILRYTNLSALNQNITHTVVFYQGNINQFSNEHAPYAILAIIFLMFITIIPPFLLLVYPLCFKLFTVMKISKFEIIKVLLEVSILKMKPILDAFQGSFKDEFRFFSGIYFGYRVFLLLATLVPRISQTFVVLQIELVVMLTIHSLCWPYANRKHNIIDSFIFSNLCVINALLFLNHVYSKYVNSYQSVINISSCFLLLLLCGPMLYLCGYITVSLYHAIKRRYFQAVSFSSDNEYHISLDELGADREAGEKFDYKEFGSSLHNSV